MSYGNTPFGFGVPASRTISRPYGTVFNRTYRQKLTPLVARPPSHVVSPARRPLARPGLTAGREAKISNKKHSPVAATASASSTRPLVRGVSCDIVDKNKVPNELSLHHESNVVNHDETLHNGSIHITMDERSETLES